MLRKTAIAKKRILAESGSYLGSVSVCEFKKN